MQLINLVLQFFWRCGKQCGIISIAQFPYCTTTYDTSSSIFSAISTSRMIFSPQIINSSGDRPQPCLKPLSKENGAV